MYLNYIKLFLLFFTLFSCSLNDRDLNKVKKQNKNNLIIKLDDLAQSIVDEIDKNLIKKIAIMDFEANALDAKTIASFVTDEFTFNLFLKNEFTIIERDHLSYVIEQQKLNNSGLVKSSINEIGNLLSVDAIIIGQITKQSKENLLSIKILSVKTGEVLFIKNISFYDFIENDALNENIHELTKKSKKSPKGNPKKIDSKRFKKLVKEIVFLLETRDLKTLKKMMATKQEYEKYLLINFKGDSNKRTQIKKNIRTEYNLYKKNYNKNIRIILKQLKKSNVDIQTLKIKKITPKIMSVFNTKKIYKVDTIFENDDDKIKLNFHAMFINGRWIINNLFVKKLK